MSRMCSVLVGGVTAALLLLGHGVVSAQFTYNYTGRPFDAFGVGAPPGNVIATLTFASLLAPSSTSGANVAGGVITPGSGTALTAITISLGSGAPAFTISQPGNTTYSGSISVTTDSAGSISAWAIALNDGLRGIHSSSSAVNPPLGGSSTYDYTLTPGFGYWAGTRNAPLSGSWTQATAEVPEPASLAIWLVLAGTGAIVGWRRRRKQH